MVPVDARRRRAPPSRRGPTLGALFLADHPDQGGQDVMGLGGVDVHVSAARDAAGRGCRAVAHG